MSEETKDKELPKMTQEELIAYAREAIKNMPDLSRIPTPQKEIGSPGLACMCWSKMHPDPDCPMGCGRRFK